MRVIHRRCLRLLAVLALGACQADPRGEVATAATATGLRCTYEGETPPTVAGARTVGAGEVQALRSGARPAVLIDVASGDTRRSVPGAVWLPGAGSCDRDAPRMQARLEARMAELTGGDRSRPVVVFCPSRSCWLSWNAAQRLAQAGYTDIAWFRDGTEGWSRAGQRLETVQRGW